MDKFTDATSFATAVKAELAAQESTSESPDTATAEATEESSEQQSEETDAEPETAEGEDSSEGDDSAASESDEEAGDEEREEGDDSEDSPDSIEAFQAKQREWRIKERSLKKSVEELTAKASQLEEKNSHVEGFFEEFRKNPVKFLEKYRPDVYEQWTMEKAGIPSESKVSTGSTDPDPRFESLSKELQAIKRHQEQEKIELQKSRYVREAAKIVKKSDFSELTSYCAKLGLDPAKEALDYAVEIARRDRVSLTPKEAAQGLQDWVKKQKKAFIQEEKKEKKPEKKATQKPKSISTKMAKTSAEPQKRPQTKEEWLQAAKNDIRKLQQ